MQRRENKLCYHRFLIFQHKVGLKQFQNSFDSLKSNTPSLDWIVSHIASSSGVTNVCFVGCQLVWLSTLSCRILKKHFQFDITHLTSAALFEAVEENGNQVHFIRKSAVLFQLSKHNVKIIRMKLFRKQGFLFCQPILEKKKRSHHMCWHHRINLCDMWQAGKGRSFIMGSTHCPWIASQAVPWLLLMSEHDQSCTSWVCGRENCAFNTQ